MSSEYITLLDCSHNQSDEFLGGNLKTNSLYTNKLGSGLQINAGDKISLHNGFVAETGSDDNSIRINNNFVANRKLKYTKLSYENKTNDINNYIYGYERITASNVEENIETYNNKTSIAINFYKTGNGENYFNLPRRFVHTTIDGAVQEWLVPDTTADGRSNASQVYSTDTNASYNGSNLSIFMVDEDYYYFQAGDGDPTKKVNCFKISNSNSRYMIMIRTDTRYGAYTGTAPDMLNASIQTPADFEYIEYIQKIDIDIPQGFRSPEAIASIISDTLRKQEQPQRNFVESSATFNANASLVTDRPVNVELNSPCYKTFFSASPFTNNSPNYTSFASNVVDVAGSNKYLSSYQYIGVKRPEMWLRGREFATYFKDYLNSKVPDSVKTITGATAQLRYDLLEPAFTRITPTGDRQYQIVLELVWEDSYEIMRRLSLIFKEQGKHPELFTNRFTQLRGFTNENNSRFIHMNAVDTTIRRSYDSNFAFTLGQDFYKINASGNDDLNSVPLFFDFNSVYENLSPEQGGESWDNGYAYGTFLKYFDSISNKNYISLTTSHLGIQSDNSLNASFTTIPNCLFNDNNASKNKISEFTRVGWDTHFNSYGNATIGLLDGWKRRMFHESEFLEMLPTGYNPDEINTALYSQKIYLGADEPLMEYNTISNRFELSQLHSAERVQNRYNAGGVASASGHTIEIVPQFSTSGDKVYKLNKRVFNTTFTPVLMPYQLNRVDDLKVAGSDAGDYQVDFLNTNLSGWTIYDQLCGIIIKDFGYDENNWEKSFWNTIGFDYLQFNSTRTSANDLTTRIGNDNKDTLPYAITNANVGTLDTIDFVTNIFGAGMYNLSLPSTMSFNSSNSGANVNAKFRANLRYENFPAVTETQHSIKLVAGRLPRKLQNPYFCIRSDILDESSYIGGYESGQIYPVIATIPKSNDYGDYFVSVGSDLEFTFTRPKTITHIKTAITNPDQTLADVDRNSSIIYKLTRNLNPNRFNIVEQVLNEK